MPITLAVTGHTDLSAHRLSRAEARDWLDKAGVWFEGIGDAVLDAKLVRDSEGKSVLLVWMHPAAPPAEVRLGASGRVRVSAATSPAGPGYHIALCSLLRHFAADFDIVWDDYETLDPTGYFRTEIRAACERYFLKCLAKWCSAVPAPRHLGLPPERTFSFPASVLTPLGPRDAHWLRGTAADPDDGREYFPWWNSTANAAFYRGRALTRLWCDFPWRPPLTEAEGELTDQLANDLAAAFKLDPEAQLPWTEWLELLCAIENDAGRFTVTPKDAALVAELQTRAANDERHEPIGYRRHPMRLRLTAGWSVEVPGDFASEWDDERTWTGWNALRTVWFHALGFTKPNGERPTSAEALELGRRSLPEGEPLPDADEPDHKGAAVFGPTEEEGRTVWRLSGVAAVAGQLAVCNVYSECAGDRDWAIRTWASLRHGD